MQINELRKELKFNTELLQLIETLKNIAAAQYHVMEKEKERFDEFMNAFSGFFRVINLVDVEDPLVRVVSDVLGIVIVTSDSGFMGGLNQGVIREAMAVQGDLPDDKVALVVIGDKGVGVMADRGVKFKGFPGINQERIYEQSVEIKDYIVQEVLARRMGKVVVAYPKPLSFTAQDVDVIPILPCAELFSSEKQDEVAGEKEKEHGIKFLADARKVVVESKLSDMVEYLAGTWVESKLFEVFEDSKLAEFSARAMHLEGSLQKIQTEFKKIKHMYSKAVHELIDKGMRESYAARGGRKRRKKRQDATDRRIDEAKAARKEYEAVNE